MKYLTKDLILQSKDLQQKEVAVPEWGGTVLVRGMTGTERDAFEGSVVSMNGKDVSVNYENMRTKLLVRCIVDENGDRIFDDADISVLAAKSAIALNRVYEVAQKLSGIGKEDVDELIKN